MIHMRVFIFKLLPAKKQSPFRNGSLSGAFWSSSGNEGLDTVASRWCPLPVLFSLPQRAERRSPIPPRHALTVEREIPLADVADPAEISVDDENRLRVQAGLPGNNVVALTTPADLAEVLDRVTKTHQVLVVDYYAPWCRACQKLLRYVHKIAREPKFQNVEFATVDFDRSEDLVKSRQVDRLPTMEIYNGQDLKQRWSGANTKKFLERLETEVDESVPQDVMSG